MSKIHPCNLYFLILMLLPHQQLINRGQQFAIAAFQFNNAYDYLESNDKDLNYNYQEGSEGVELEDDDIQDTSNLIQDRQPFVDTHDDNEVDNTKQSATPPQAPARRASNDDEIQGDTHATAELMRNSNSECAKEMDACAKAEEAKAQQDAIDHVTCLIKSMREHAITIIKNMNELETDLLASNEVEDKTDCTTECPTTTECPAGGGGGAGGSSSGVGGSSSCEDTSSSSKSKCFNDAEASNKKCNEDNESNKCSTNNNNNCNTSNDSSDCKSSAVNKMKSNCNINLDTPVVVNEFSLPLKNDGTLTKSQSSSELMGQAQDAVRSWKAQIESCKRVLDDAVAQAAETDKQTSNSHNRQGSEPTKLRDPYAFLNLRKSAKASIAANSDSDKSKSNILSTGKVTTSHSSGIASPVAASAALRPKTTDTGVKDTKASVIAATATSTATKTSTGAVKDTPAAASPHSTTDDIMKNSAAAKNNMIRRDFKPVRLLKAKTEERKRKYSGKYDGPRTRNSHLWGM